MNHLVRSHRHSLLSHLWIFCIPCSQSVPGEVDQVQPLLSGARGQEGGLQQTWGRADCWGEGAEGAQSNQTHQGCKQWRNQLHVQGPSPQVEQKAIQITTGRCHLHLPVLRVDVRWSLLTLLFSKFLNMMMKHGNKVLAREILTQVSLF